MDEVEVDSGGPARRDCKVGEGLNGCRCCFTPDRMFENACDAIVALNIEGMDINQSQKFVRLCVADVNGTMQLSKKKRYCSLSYSLIRAFLVSIANGSFRFVNLGKLPPDWAKLECSQKLRLMQCRNASMKHTKIC